MRGKDATNRSLKEEELALKREKLPLEMKRKDQRDNGETLMLDLLAKFSEKLN